jgi:hypothetical protein
MTADFAKETAENCRHNCDFLSIAPSLYSSPHGVWLGFSPVAASLLLENLPPPDVLAREIVENLQAALEQFNSITEELARQTSQN